jgi:hypothetical protein
MYSATFKIEGTNYKIESCPIQVPNMENELEKISKFVEKNGGTQKEFSINFYKEYNGSEGYYRGLRFSKEFFIDGILINLVGHTTINRKHYVNPLRRNLTQDITHGGVLLSRIKEYDNYAKDKERKLIEQAPELSDDGILTLTLEGAVKHLVNEKPEFYSVTGISHDWKPSLILLTNEQFEDEKKREEIRNILSLEKNFWNQTKSKALKQYPDLANKYRDIFDAVWNKK